VGEVEDEMRKWLRAIKGVTCYTEKMKVYAPTCYDRCLPAVQKLVAKLNTIFGGSTVYDAEGSWITDTRLEKEPIKVIEIGHRCTEPETAKRFAEAITDYAKEAKQGAIAIHETDFFIARTTELLKAFEKLKEKVP